MHQHSVEQTDWMHRPLGKAARAVIAISGLTASFLFLLLAGMVSTGVWVLVVGGVALAATSVRAAWVPSRNRLLAVAANLAAIPLFTQVI